MKSGELHPKEGVWNWERADKIADFCRKNGIKLRGHCLVWHAQFCDWMMNDEKGNPVPKEVFYARLRDHIHTVVNRYKDVVYAWDVVNEAMSDAAADSEVVNPTPTAKASSTSSTATSSLPRHLNLLTKPIPMPFFSITTTMQPFPQSATAYTTW